MRTIFVTDDTIINPAVKVFEQFTEPSLVVEHVKLSDFLKSFGCEFDSTNGHLSMPGPSQRGSKEEGVRFVDCVVEISSDTLANLGDENGLLARGQVSYCYQVLLEQLQEGPRKNRSYSTVGKLLPLFTQWALVEKNFSDISVPRYKYGYGPEEISSDDFSQPIHKSPFDFYKWRPNERADDLPFDAFIVDRPSGIPVLSYFLGDDVVVSVLSDERDPPAQEQLNLLRERTVWMKSLFDADMGECLWFVDDVANTFAAFSHHLSAASRQPGFEELAAAYVGAGYA